MKKIRVAINGFGRIGRVCTRYLLQNKNIELVAINDLTDTKTLAHLFKYDSIHKQFNGTVSHSDKSLTLNDQLIYVYSSRNPEDLPWKELDIDIVIESTGIFRTKKEATKHLTAGAKKVIISVPPKDDSIESVVLGVNEKALSEGEKILSNASCTTNCAAPMVKVLDELWGIESGYISTIHSYTGDQRLHDSPHSDLRRARAAAYSIIPTSTGAANAIIKIFPHLAGKMAGAGIRVPVPDGSLTELTCILKRQASADEMNAAFKAVSENEMKGILGYTDEPLVSIDIVGNSHSCILDSGLTTSLGTMVKVVGWYDNESGYSARLASLVEKFAQSE